MDNNAVKQLSKLLSLMFVNFELQQTYLQKGINWVTIFTVDINSLCQWELWNKACAKDFVRKACTVLRNQTLTFSRADVLDGIKDLLWIRSWLLL